MTLGEINQLLALSERKEPKLYGLIEKVTIPEGESGVWRVERFDVPENSIQQMRLAMSGRYLPAGTYTSLKRGGKLVMSDTPDEMRDHAWFVNKATGHCLINGLGLGMCLKAILKKGDVTQVTVIEKSRDVLALVSPHYTDKRVQYIHADAFEYQPPKGARYCAVWHDIWDDICADNLPEMKTLHRKYGRRADWQGSWCRSLCERHAA